MIADIEIRSSGQGPRQRHYGPASTTDEAEAILSIAWVMTKRWEREIVKRAAMRTVTDGVAIIIRRGET